MPRVTFTHTLQRHVSAPPAEVAGNTVREVLEAVFRDNARARHYVLDDQGALRKHMVVFVDGQQVRDRVQRSDDGGDSWTLVESLWNDPRRREWFGGGADLPGIHSLCVDPRDSRRVTLGVSCGGFWQTTDDGASWALRSQDMWANYMPPERKFDPVIQDPHQIAQCAAAPDVFWAQHHNGVLKATAGSETWTLVGERGPG